MEVAGPFGGVNCITLAPTETARMLAHESVVAANPGVKLAVYVDTVAFSRDDAGIHIGTAAQTDS